jgi:hypothetical protein
MKYSQSSFLNSSFHPVKAFLLPMAVRLPLYALTSLVMSPVEASMLCVSKVVVAAGTFTLSS